MGSNMIILILFLICLIIIEQVKESNNKDLIKENCKNKETYDNIKHAEKVFHKTKIANIILIVSIVIFIVFLLWDFTSIEVPIMEYISADFYTEKEFDKTLYMLPLYILIAREIIIQVKIGEFLLKYFNVEEPQLEENLLKTLLYKKKSPIKIKFNKKESTTTTDENNKPDS